MSDDTIQQHIHEQVLSRVKSGSVHMRSRAYFFLRVTTTAVTALLVLGISSLILSFIGFSIHASGQDILLGFGARGIGTFFALFPWPLFIADLLLMLALEWCLQGFRFGYRFSLVSIFVLTFAMSWFLGFLIELTPLHDSLLSAADRGELPIAGGLYEHIRDPHHDLGIFRGTVFSVQNGQVMIGHDDGDHDPDDGTWTVALPPDTPPPQVGDRMLVFGSSTGSQVDAYGIEHLSPEQ